MCIINLPLQDLNNQLKKLSGEIGERESALEQQYEELLDQTNRRVQAHEVTIQRLTSTLADKEQQLQVRLKNLTFSDQNNKCFCLYSFLFPIGISDNEYMLLVFYLVFLCVHQEYINMVRDFEQSKSPGGNDNVLSKLRQRLKEKEKALEVHISSV